MKSILKRENKQWRRRNFVIQTVMEFRPPQKNQEKEQITQKSNTLLPTPIRDILHHRKSPITKLSESSKTRYTKDLEELRKKALKQL